VTPQDLAVFERQEIGGLFHVGEKRLTWVNRSNAGDRVTDVNGAEWNFTPYTLFTGLEKFLRNA
jgi:hypothetical protein